MIDKRLYQETFSHLRASDQAKQEVFQKMQEIMGRLRHGMTQIGGKEVLAFRDYSQGLDGLPPSDVPGQ